MKKYLVLALLLWASTASAQTVVKTSGVGAQNATSVSSVAFSPSAGDYMAVHCNASVATTSPAVVTDTQGNTYAPPPGSGDVHLGGRDGEWFISTVQAGADTVKCTYKASTAFINVFAVDIHGATGTDVIFNSSGSSNTPTATSTTTQPNEVTLGVVLCSANCPTSSGQNYTSDGFGNALATQTTANPGAVTISFSSSSGIWMEQLLGFVNTSNATPPVVTMNPVPIQGYVGISANVSDATPVTQVQYLLDGANLGNPVTAAPWVFTWNTTGTTNASHTLAATALNSVGQSTTSAAITVVVNNSGTSEMQISTPVTLAQGTVSTPYNQNLAAADGLSGGVPPYTFAPVAGTVPPGLTLSSAGILSGTPTSAGNYSFSYSVTDSSGSAVIYQIKILAVKKEVRQ